MIKISAFTTGSNIPKRNTKVNLNRNNNLEDVAKIISKSKGKINDKNINKILDVCQDLFKDALSSTIKGNIKIGNALIGADMIGHSLVTVLNILSKYSSKKSNSSINRSIINSTSHRYNITIGQPTQGIFNTKGYSHIYNKVEIFSTEENEQSNSARLNLNSACGTNQKIIEIFSEKTYLSIRGLKTFTRVDEHLKRAEERRNKLETDNLEKGSKIRKAIKNNFINSLARERLYSGVRKHISYLDIYNTMPNHVTYVKIYICCHKAYNNCGIYDAADLKAKLLKTMDNNPTAFGKRYLKETDICKNKNLHGSNSFKETIKVKKHVDIKKTEAWREHVCVLKQITVPLLSSDHVRVKLTHNYKFGIDLSDLDQCAANSASSHTYFIIEAVGGGCQLTSTEDKTIKRRGTSPVQLRYEFKHWIEYMCDKDKRDTPVVERIVEQNNSFEDIFLHEEFYPTREDLFDVDHKDIDIDGSNRNAKWILDIDASTDQAHSIIALQNRLLENNVEIEPEDVNKIYNEQSKDEEVYNNSSSTSSKDKDDSHKNLFGEFFTKINDDFEDTDTIEDLDD